MSTNGPKSRTDPTYVICLEHGEYEVDLVVGKVYRTTKREENDRPVDLRVIDESGEDYLYPAKWFVVVDLPAKAKRMLAAT